MLRALSCAIALLLIVPAQAAQKATRTGARSSVNNSGSRNNNANRNTNRNTNVNRNTNINRDIDVHRDIDIDIDVDHHYGHDYGCCYHPVATAAAVTAAAVVTAAAIGSMVNTLPPACTAIYMNGITYQQCGSTWYQPQFVGTSMTYVVVAPLR